MRLLGGVVWVCALSLLLTGTLSQDVGSILTKPVYDQMFKHRNDAICPAKGVYTYEAFMEAAKSFTAFGTTGDVDTRKREIAAFFAQFSHETSGGWANAPDGPYAWGFCCINTGDLYAQSQQGRPCASDNNYFGRGLNQISYNYEDAVNAFKVLIEVWMHPESSIYMPSPHDVMTGKWTPSRQTSPPAVPPVMVWSPTSSAERANVGRGLIRRWRTELDFTRDIVTFLALGMGIIWTAPTKNLLNK